MPFLFFDSTMIILIPALILAFYAQSKVKNTFRKYSKVRSASGLSGSQLARKILDANGLSDVPVNQVKGNLTDHYHPGKRELYLSDSVYGSESVAALGVAAHEVGHAIQHSAGYSPLIIRNTFVPVASIGSNLALPLFLVGFFFSASIGWLMDVGILFFAAAVAFHLVTLPVEFNASSRAVASLGDMGYLQGEEVGYARSVLNAAAWTYVATATMAMAQLIRLVLLRSRSD